jgi:hypothetical protein
MPTQRFTAPKKEPLTVELGADGGPVETYQLAAELPAGVALDFYAQGENIKIGAEFMALVMTPEDHQRFTRQIHDREHVIGTDTVIALFRWVAQQYVGPVPTGGPTASPAGGSAIEASSTEAVSSPG